MTIRDYIGQKFSAYGDLSEADMLGAMFVTPKDIDEAVKRLSYTISEGLNLAFSRF